MSIKSAVEMIQTKTKAFIKIFETKASLVLKSNESINGINSVYWDVEAFIVKN